MADQAIEVFDDAAEEYGRPRHIVIDDCTQFHSARGSTSLSDQCRHDGRIMHIRGRIVKPTTQGKIGRFLCVEDGI